MEKNLVFIIIKIAISLAFSMMFYNYIGRYLIFPVYKNAITIEEADTNNSFYIVKNTQSMPIGLTLVGDVKGLYDSERYIDIAPESKSNFIDELKYTNIFEEKTNYFICYGYILSSKGDIIEFEQLLDEEKYFLLVQNWDIIAPIDRGNINDKYDLINLFMSKKYLSKEDFKY